MASRVSLERAWALLRLKRYEAAVAEVVEYLADYPQDAQGHTLLAINFVSLRRWDEASMAMQAAIELAPADPFVLSSAGFVNLRRGNLDAAERAIRESLRLNCTDPYPHNLLACVLSRRGALEESLQACDAALQLAPENAEYLVMRGYVLSLLGRTEAAEVTLREALSHDAENPEAHENQGINLLRQRQPKLALEHLLEARRLSPVEKENAELIMKALGQQHWLVQVLQRVAPPWQRWHWMAIWAAFSVFLCGGMLLYQATFAASLPWWIKPAFIVANVNFLVLPLTVWLAADWIGTLLASPAPRNPWDRPLELTVVAVVLLGFQWLLSWLAMEWEVVLMAANMVIVSFAAVSLLWQSKVPRRRVRPFLDCAFLPSIVGGLMINQCVDRSPLFGAMLLAFLFLSFVSNFVAAKWSLR